VPMGGFCADRVRDEALADADSIRRFAGTAPWGQFAGAGRERVTRYTGMRPSAP